MVSAIVIHRNSFYTTTTLLYLDVVVAQRDHTEESNEIKYQKDLFPTDPCLAWLLILP